MSHPLAFLQFSHKRRVPILRQTEAAECGLACLAMVAHFHGYQTDLNSLRRRFSISLMGATLKTLIKIADDMGLSSRPLRAELSHLDQVTLPVILHWDMNHFVVLVAIKRTLSGLRYVLHDPARGEVVMIEEELSQHFTGVLLELTPTTRFERKQERTRLRLNQLWTRVSGLKRAIVQILALSLLLQLFALAGPFYLQLAIDTALPAFDTNLLTALALGFAGLTLLNLITTGIRQFALLILGNALGYQLVANLFRHLIRLPMSYFEKRHTGDVISRFESTLPITEILSKGVISVVIDGLMALATLALMALYSPMLAGVVLAALLLYILLRWAWFGTLQASNVNLIAARAAESSTMIETVRGMAAIKLFAREGDRQRLWQHKRADVVNANIRLGKLQAWFDVANAAVLGLENILFVYLAVRLAIKAEMTVGMIFAFQSYKQQFLTAGLNLVGKAVEFKMLDVHMDRIADIALTQPEAQTPMTPNDEPKPLSGHLVLQGLRFAYGQGEPEVLRGVDLRVEPGETLAIIGPSGGGKTTLLKIMLGLHEASSGEMLVDGEPLARYGLGRYRRQIAAVMQEDVLYAGSLAENISFLDVETDMERVHAAAKAACIHDEIMAMPMGYESLVGDMGSTLSGGQKQRVLLSRALYQQPRILFMDEGTAHLDVRTEAAVNASISALGVTRVIIAHRPETIRMAERVVALVNGQMVEVKSDLPAEAQASA